MRCSKRLALTYGVFRGLDTMSLSLAISLSLCADACSAA